MQIDHIRISDVIKNEKVDDTSAIVSDKVSKKKTKESVEELRDIQMDSPFYSKKVLAQDTVADQLEKDLQRGTDETSLRNEVAVYANTTSPEDMKKMQEEGYDPMSTDVHTIVTVVDRIKMELAKSGKDVSAMGGISDDKIEAMTGSASAAVQVKQQLSDFAIPMDDDLKKKVSTAVYKVEELSNPISEESVKYLLDNELSPTIDHIYQASFATGSAEFSQNNAEEFVPAELPSEEMAAQFSAVIEETELENNEVAVSDCQWMVENDIPVTAENLTYLQMLKEIDLEPEEEQLADMITDAVLEGKQPGEAILCPDECKVTQAKEILAKQEKELAGITATRQVQEARLVMSVQANYALLKKGIQIDTMSIQEVVDEWKAMEEAYRKELLGSEDKVRVYDDFFTQVETLKEAPAAVLGFAQKVMDMTMSEFGDAAASVKNQVQKAMNTYEALWTAPRKDMGDSIQKAFSNVDDILEDLDLEVSEDNRRAVRILSYNEMELTKENINTVKTADAQVQRMFAALKPATVTEMIKSGQNPLDMKIGDLTELAEDMSQEMGQNAEEEKFAKFLWKLEQTKDISPEQRESYIGVYRLIHQVEAGDGAAIGALLAQGTEVTLRNLMTAVRSGKHTGRDYRVDDHFGEVESFDRSSLSITEQIEMAFQKECLHDAGETMTPVKMKAFGDEANYMDLTPEQFHNELQAMDSVEVQEQEQLQETTYAKQTQETVAKALESEQEVYHMLERYDMPTTPAYLEGVAEMLRDRNSVYRNLLKYSAPDENREKGITDLIEDLIIEYGESVKTPKEMADAQRRLEETAENVMKKMMVEKDVSSIDVRGMKLVHTQIQALGKIAEREENYQIPIMVEDKLGNLSLKIVRGSEEKGLVDIALETEDIGVVSASFRYEAGEVRGDVSFERREVQTIFSDHMQLLAEAMQEETGLPVSFAFGWDKDAQIQDFYQERDVDFEKTETRDEVSTKVLYGVAKSFMDTLTEII